MGTRFTSKLQFMIIVCISCPLVGCTRSGSIEDERSHDFKIELIGAIQYAINAGNPKHPGDLRLELDLTIGKEDGPEEYILYRPSSLAVDGRGWMFLFDWSRKAILVYDHEGQYVRTLGREGQGPGEFDQMGGAELFAYTDGTIDAIALSGAHWKRWDPEGVLLFDHHAFNLRTARGMIRFPTYDGLTSYAYTNRTVVIDTMNAWRIHRISADAKLQDVVATYPLGRRSYAEGNYKGHSLGIVLPYIADLTTARGSSGLITSTMGDSARFDVYNEQFKHLFTVTWDQLPVPLERKEVEEAYWQLPMNDPEDVEARNDPMWGFFQTIESPMDKPVVYDLLVDSEDQVWVQLWGDTGWPGGWSPSPEYIEYAVFSNEGEFLYQTRIPFEIEAVDGKYLYDVFSDGEHTPQIRRYRWEPPLSAERSIP